MWQSGNYYRNKIGIGTSILIGMDIDHAYNLQNLRNWARFGLSPERAQDKACQAHTGPSPNEPVPKYIPRPIRPGHMGWAKGV